MKTVIKNIAELIQTEDTPRKWVSGNDMKNITTIKDAFVEIEEGIITSFGSMDSWTGIDDWNNTEVIDAEGGMVFPTYCDSHTHLIFTSSREDEFVDRINGLSYQEIAEKGGGILNSVKKLQNTTEDELFEDALVRLNELVKMGSSIKICLVADGSAHVYPRFGPTMEWDTAAAHAVVNYAGGKILNLTCEKEELTYNKKNLLNPEFLVNYN